ncbi:hypothetical protein COLO4_28346 [Corchorus olitorius]|uniref:Uncharacterized protein n=1 Tax=Corchorus olitorius TaxID=93759 RepID=A0A1R3HLM7_9ROSI|nr:hypothetical protein COLO4_28346 [Corchorus olitorius]
MPFPPLYATGNRQRLLGCLSNRNFRPEKNPAKQP